MAETSEQFLDHLASIEAAAEEVLVDKQQLIDLDRKRQKTREAIRVVQKDKRTQKNWVCFGNMFLKLPRQQTYTLLEKDFNQLDSNLSDIRKGLKIKVNKLRDLENIEDIKGFNLNPLSQEEMRALEALT